MRAPISNEAQKWLDLLSVDPSKAEAAIAASLPIVRSDQQTITWLLVLGLAHYHLAQYKTALNVLQREDLELVEDVDYLVLLGMVARQLPGKSDVALRSYRRALLLNPLRFDAHYNIGNLIADEDPDAAISHYRQALGIESNLASLWHNFGKTLLHLGDELDYALLVLKISIRLDPTVSDVWCNLGLVWYMKQRLDLAESCFNHSIAIDMDLKNIPLNTNLLYQRCLKLLLRQGCYAKSLANALWNLSLLWLFTGDYKLGWYYYDARFATRDYDEVETPTGGKRVYKLADLPDPEGPELVVWAEQGMGDVIHFCRYLLLLKARGVRFQFLIFNHQTLFTLCRDWLGLGHSVSIHLPHSREHDQRPNIPLLSLPRLFGTDLHTVPAITPYLSAPEQAPEHLHITEPPGGLAVGLVWATNPLNKPMYRQKTCPLELLMPSLIDLIDLDLIELHSLQVGADASELDPWNGHGRLFDWSDRLKDFSDTAHVIQQLDLVISVDTAVAHLAAALNKPTWLLLPYTPDYRWMQFTSFSNWYPSMRLFRQKRSADWRSVTQQLRSAFDELFLLDLKALTEELIVR